MTNITRFTSIPIPISTYTSKRALRETMTETETNWFSINQKPTNRFLKDWFSVFPILVCFY
jgi:hypothetical protein